MTLQDAPGISCTYSSNTNQSIKPSSMHVQNPTKVLEKEKLPSAISESG